MILILDFLDVIRSLRKFDRCVVLLSFLCCLYTVIVHMNDLGVGHIHIQTSEVIDNGCQCIEVYSCIIRYVQVKVCIQHGDRLLCLAVCIGSICLGVSFLVAESHIQKSITVNRYQFYVLGVVVDTCDDDRITVLAAESCILVTVVNTKQCIGSITCQ